MGKNTQIFMVALALLISASYSDQQVPLIKGEYGYSIGNIQKYDISIQFFIDFLCPDSRNSYNQWKTVRKTIDLYNQKIKLTYQFNPLSFHFYAVKANQAFFYVWDKAGTIGAQKFIDYVFANQDDFAQEKWLDFTMPQFLDSFANRIAYATKVNETELRQELQAGTKSSYAVRSHWKYTVGSNGIAGAPQFKMNGVFIDGADDFSANQWIKLIQSYKNSQNKQKKDKKQIREAIESIFIDPKH